METRQIIWRINIFKCLTVTRYLNIFNDNKGREDKQRNRTYSNERNISYVRIHGDVMFLQNRSPYFHSYMQLRSKIIIRAHYANRREI